MDIFKPAQDDFALSQELPLSSDVVEGQGEADGSGSAENGSFQATDVYARVCERDGISRGIPDAARVLTQPKAGVCITLLSTEQEVVRICDFPCVVGRGQGADLDLSRYEGVSRKHLVLRCLWDAHVTLEDLGSTNGTYLNGVVLHPHSPVRLCVDDVIQVGAALYKVLQC